MNKAIDTVSSQLPATPASAAAASASASASAAASSAAAAVAAGVDGWMFGPTTELRDAALARGDGADAGGA
jgi:hypothetical protein